jgi:predicted ATP-binding protein involved in virulence
MKLISFIAKNVHGYLNFNVEFNKDVNFIAGLNGAGKTTVLDLIVAILSASLTDIASIEFDSIMLKIEDNEKKEMTISCKTVKELIEIETSRTDTKVTIDRCEVDNLEKFEILRKNRNHPVIKQINNLPSPMFLSLDRRFIREAQPSSNQNWFVNERVRNKGKWLDEKNRSNRDSSLDEVLELISYNYSRIKEKESIQEKSLRDSILLDSFSIEKTDPDFSAPPKSILEELKSKKNKIHTVLTNIDLDNEKFERKLDQFFENLENVASKVVAINEKRSKKGAEIDVTELETDDINALSAWFLNRHQFERMNRLFEVVQRYEVSKIKIYKSINDFEKIVNSFLEQTNKRISIESRGVVKIFIGENERTLKVLSSGEKQILIMLAHLSLNPNLPQNGLFIVDEPELSLHLAWQEMFVDAIQSVNPDLQLILATHSPAIINGKDQYYVPLNGGL